jgi:hypothetical protein
LLKEKGAILGGTEITKKTNGQKKKKEKKDISEL